MAFQLGERDMRLQLQRAVQMRGGNQMAQVVPPRLILRVERQVIDWLPLAAQNPQQGADDRLHAFAQRRAREHRGGVKPIAIADGNGGKAAFFGQFGNGLGIDGPFEHRIAGDDAQRDKGSMGHGANLQAQEAPIKPARALDGEKSVVIRNAGSLVYAAHSKTVTLRGNKVDNLPGNIDSAALISRAKGILLNPTAEWAQIATERDEPKSVFLRYALPLALISPIAGFIGGQVFGFGGFGVTINLGLMAGLTIAVTSFVLSLVGLFIVAFAANFLSPKFGGRDDFPAAFRLVAYSWTAAWLAGIFGLIPSLGLLSILGLYSLYLLYLGARPVMGVPDDKAVVYTVVTIVAAIVAQIVVGAVVAAITTPMIASAALSGGAVDIDLGQAGGLESNADGTMTITGPDGEEVTITVDDNKSE